MGEGKGREGTLCISGSIQICSLYLHLQEGYKVAMKVKWNLDLWKPFVEGCLFQGSLTSLLNKHIIMSIYFHMCLSVWCVCMFAYVGTYAQVCVDTQGRHQDFSSITLHHVY